MRWASVPQMETALTRARTSLGPGTGTGTSRSSKRPGSRTTSASMVSGTSGPPQHGIGSRSRGCRVACPVGDAARTSGAGSDAGQLVVERAGVPGLDVLHHVALADVDGAEAVPEVDPGNGLVASPALRDRRLDGRHPGPQVGGLHVQVLLADDRAVARDDAVHVERPDPVQVLEPLGDVGGHEPRLAAGEDGVPGEDEALLRDVDGELAGGVAGGMEAVEGVVADVEGEVAGEHDRAL